MEEFDFLQDCYVNQLPKNFKKKDLKDKYNNIVQHLNKDREIDLKEIIDIRFKFIEEQCFIKHESLMISLDTVEEKLINQVNKFEKKIISNKPTSLRMKITKFNFDAKNMGIIFNNNQIYRPIYGSINSFVITYLCNMCYTISRMVDNKDVEGFKYNAKNNYWIKIMIDNDENNKKNVLCCTNESDCFTTTHKDT